MIAKMKDNCINVEGNGGYDRKQGNENFLESELEGVMAIVNVHR